MEGQNGYQNPLELMLLNLGGTVNDIDTGDGDDDHHFVTSEGMSDQNQLANYNPPLSTNLPHRFQDSHKTTVSYYEFLTENSSSFADKDLSTADTHYHVFDSIPPPTPPVPDSRFIQGLVTDLQSDELFYDYYTSVMASSSYKPLLDSSLDADSWKLNLFPCIFNTDNVQSSHHERSYDAEDLVNKYKRTQDQSQSLSHVSWTQEPSEVFGNALQSFPRAKVSASVFLSNPGSNTSRQRAASNDRQRRERIAKRLKALQELLPHSVKGSQTAAMDEIINYVKYLQLQVKELSWSKLGGHFCPGPSIFLEGDQHYILHEQTMSEPLEETIAQALKVNSSAATKFLESKGLFVMPMALADGLKQAI